MDQFAYDAYEQSTMCRQFPVGETIDFHSIIMYQYLSIYSVDLEMGHVPFSAQQLTVANDLE